MNSNFRWRWGETNPVVANVASETVVHIGDLLWLNRNTGNVQPASEHTFSGSLSATQVQFTTGFIGVAMQASPAGSDTPIRIATSGTFQFESVGATPRLGQFAGSTNGGSGNSLRNQTLTTVSSASAAVGRVVHTQGVETGTVFVAILSAVIHGGASGQAFEYGSSSSS